MPIDTERQFAEERAPFIEYEVIDETQDKHKDPFIPAQEVEPTRPEDILVRIEL